MQQTMQSDSEDPVLKLAARLHKYDLRISSGAIGGLMLRPEFQASTYRLEMLAHAVVTSCGGDTKPRQRDLAEWLTEAGKVVGHLEDPIEDVFAGRVDYRGQNYRVLEGLSEGGCFQLQIMLRIVERMPESFAELKNGCRDCLILAEALCERAGVVAFESGTEYPLRRRVARSVVPSIRALSKSVTFSKRDLSYLDVSTDVLERFSLPLTKRNVLPNYAGNSELYCRPFLKLGNDLVVVLPTAIGHAIRTAVIETYRLPGPAAEQDLRKQHLFIIVKQLLDTPMIRGLGLNPIGLDLQPIISIEPVEIDPGYWAQVVLVVDNLADFDQDGLMGEAGNSAQVVRDLEVAIKDARQRCESNAGFKAGLTLAIMCGFGRFRVVPLRNDDPNWFVTDVSSYDAEVLGWMTDFSIADILRLVMAERDLSSKGIEIQHMNGLLAQVGNVIDNRGHLVFHEGLPDGILKGRIVVPSNTQLRPRLEYHQRHDCRVVQTPDGEFLHVRTEGSGVVTPGGATRIYVSVDDLSCGRLRAVWIQRDRVWWMETSPLSTGTLGPHTEGFDALIMWMHRIAPELDAAFPNLPNVLLWDVRIDPPPSNLFGDLGQASVDEIRAAIDVTVDRAANIITTIVAQGFWSGRSNPENIAEFALVEAFVKGVLNYLDRDESEASTLMKRIVPSPSARQLHQFATVDFRDHMRDAFDRRVVLVTPIQDGAIRIGLGLKGKQRPGGWVRGVGDCTKALNAIVSYAETALCTDLSGFNQRSLIEAAIRNHEAAAIDARRLKRTAGATIALSGDESAMREKIADRLFKLNGVTLACRLLIEISLHHCPETSGLAVGDIDLSRFMARALMIFGLGGSSDAIHYGAMKPELRISPLGEVQNDVTFFDDVLTPAGRDFANVEVDREISAYNENVSGPDLSTVPMPQQFDADFYAAWIAEMGTGFDVYCRTMVALENLCIERKRSWLVISFSELIAHLERFESDAAIVIAKLESQPRSDWKQVPIGYDDADRQPWRYRRLLSIMRRPLIRLGSSDDADMFVAPGIVREGWTTTVVNLLGGNYDEHQLHSREMRRWSQIVLRKRSAEFEREVSQTLKNLGWKVRAGIKFGEILGRNPDENPGDIDVLAWRNDGRVVLFECKSLQFAKTPSEIAKQLVKFRGFVDEKGKPDLLYKHLNRWAIAKQHKSAFSTFTGLTNPNIEAGLVFSNTVPMQFAVDKMSEKIWVGTVSDLEGFGVK